MSTKPKYEVNVPLLIVGAIVGMCSFGAWFLPMGLHYASAGVYGKAPSKLMTATHTFFTLVTLGTYLVFLGIWYAIALMSKKK